MGKFTHPMSTICYTQLPSFLAGMMEKEYPWSKCRWRTRKPGFCLNKGVTNEKKNNPRKSGDWLFVHSPSFFRKNVATDYLKCTSCLSGCNVSVKLEYKPNKMVVIKSENLILSHGVMDIIDSRADHVIRKEIITLRGSSMPPMRPMQIFINLANTHGSNMPTLSQISEIIKYEDRKNKQNFNLTSLLTNPNIVHYEENKRNFIIVIKSNPTAFNLFGASISNPDNIVGLDAQYKNNLERFPLWILCTQSEGYRTVPGFVMMSNSGTAAVLSKAIARIKQYLQDNGYHYRAITMIDKDEVERISLTQNGLRFYLCEFHLMKLLKKNFKCFGEKFNSAIEKFKDIQRSTSLTEMKVNSTLFKAFCIENQQEKVWKLIKKEYLCEMWLGSWCDFQRVGGRLGLYNTNNISEAWFKTLLRVYLGGHSYSYFRVLEIILHKVFVVADIRLGQNPPTRLNPTLKSIKKLKKLGNQLNSKAKISIQSTDAYDISYDAKSYQIIKTRKNGFTCSCFYYRWFGKSCKHVYMIEAFALANANKPGPKKIVPPRSFPKKKKRGKKRGAPFAAAKTELQKKIIKNAKEQSDEDSSETDPSNLFEGWTSSEEELSSPDNGGNSSEGTKILVDLTSTTTEEKPKKKSVNTIKKKAKGISKEEIFLDLTSTSTEEKKPKKNDKKSAKASKKNKKKFADDKIAAKKKSTKTKLGVQKIAAPMKKNYIRNGDVEKIATSKKKNTQTYLGGGSSEEILLELTSTEEKPNEKENKNQNKQQKNSKAMLIDQGTESKEEELESSKTSFSLVSEDKENFEVEEMSTSTDFVASELVQPHPRYPVRNNRGKLPFYLEVYVAK